MEGHMKALRVSFLTLFLSIFLTISGFAHSLQIHHINVNNGDATVIAVKDDQGQYVTKLLIDGGEPSADERLWPYIQSVLGNASFEYVILTHYHADHYKGLLALGKSGKIQAKYLIDPGGYDFGNNAQLSPAVLAKIQPANTGLKLGVPEQYIKAVQEAALRNIERYPAFNQTLEKTFQTINKVIPIYSDGDIEVRLRCVAYK